MMDHTAETHVISSLASDLTDVTLVISTHRLKLLNLVDRVITLDHGKVVADGPRQQILAAMTPTPEPAKAA